MQTDRFNIELKVTPHVAWHGAQADHLQAMIVGDDVIRSRVLELAEMAKKGKKPAAQAAQEGPQNLAQVS